MSETASRLAALLQRRRVYALSIGYVVVVTVITFIAGNGPTLLTPAGIAALIFAPLAVLAAFAGGYVIGIPWLLGLTDADPDDYSLVLWLPFIIVGAVANAAAYVGIGIVAWWRRQRQHRSSSS